MKTEDLYVGLRVVDKEGTTGTVVNLGRTSYSVAYDDPQYGTVEFFTAGEEIRWIEPVARAEQSQFQVKDSGARQEYASGMVRDTTEGKPDYTLLPLDFLERWATHMTKGAEKYGRENWTLASSEEELTRFKGSAFRHLIQWLRGDLDEDHAAAVAFNIAAAERVKGYLHGGS